MGNNKKIMNEDITPRKIWQYGGARKKIYAKHARLKILTGSNSNTCSKKKKKKKKIQN